MLSEQDKLRKVLKSLPCSVVSREEWLKIIFAANYCGLPWTEVDSWSREDSERYVEGEVSRTYRKASMKANSATVGTAVQICKEYGRWEAEAFIPAEHDKVLDWDEPIPYVNKEVIDVRYADEVFLREPGNDWNPIDDTRKYIQAMFRPGEKISISVGGFEQKTKNGKVKWLPNSGNALDYELIMNELNQGHRIADFFSDPGEGGGWVRINPMDGAGVFDSNVTSYRHMLVECDESEPEKQLAIIRKLELPCSAIVYSGGKSVHALVKVNAPSYEIYQKRVDFVFGVCKLHGLPLDRQNRNPSRYSRLPGVKRGESKQFLIDINCGKESYEEWEQYINELADDLPDIMPVDEYIDNPPELAPAIIDGVLRQKHKLLLSGPSKAGKSFLLMELAIAVAEGRDWMCWKCQQGRVLYINLELDSASCFNRFADLYRAMRQAHSRGMLDVWNLRGKSTPLNELAPRLIRRCFDKHYSMIILDPIYKVITGDENAASEMAAFCNCFDMIADKTGAAMVYCHHHSKGDQGQKKAMDRASGSGVFARDPDAMLDLVQLQVDEERLNQICSRASCDAICDAMDADAPNWKVTVPQDDALVLDKLRPYAHKLIGEARTESIVLSVQKRYRQATAWRVDGILREFPSFGSFNMWFAWPRHIMDTTGMLEDVRIESTQTRQREESTRARKKKKGTYSADERINQLTLAWEDIHEKKGYVMVDELLEETGMKRPNLYTFLKKNYDIMHLMAREGKVVRIQEKQS